MKRTLIIIGNQGGERNFLPGVSKDLSSYVEFFVSDYGILTESRKLFSSTNAVYEFKARRDFDKCLRDLPPMFTYATAVSPGQYASDSSN